MNKLKLTTMSYTKAKLKELEYLVIGAAIEVHKHLGPGLLESVYHSCMVSELREKKLSFDSEMRVPVIYKGQEQNVSLRCDLLVEDILVVELKSVDFLLPIFNAQVLTYMKLLQSPKGLLINFNCENIVKQGRRSLVNDIYAAMK